MERLPVSVAERLQALILSERAVAYLRLDARLNLIDAGGHLEHYGLAVRLSEPAQQQAVFLEGLLPLVETPYIVPMVEIGNGRVADLHFYVDSQTTYVLLIDVTAEHRGVQRMQQKAYDVTLLQEKEAVLNRQLETANAALVAAQARLESSQALLLRAHERLQGELAEAAGYVSSLLPAPLTEPFTAEWIFVPSMELGGDVLGYHWIDPDHFALYLLDVCGHGIGPSLLSVAVLHVLQSGSLRGADFRSPGEVLEALNDVYQMQSATDLYFTMWYGVFQPSSRRLEFGCAGHPAAVLVEPDSERVQLLKPPGLPIGLMPGSRYACESMTVPRERWLYLLSDGAFEVERADGSMLTFNEFVSLLAAVGSGQEAMAALYRRLVALNEKGRLEDDFTIARFGF